MNSLNAENLLQLFTVGMASLFGTLIAEHLMQWFITTDLIANMSMRILLMSLLGLAVFTLLVTVIVRTLLGKES